MSNSRSDNATLALDETMLQSVRTRRCAGESLKALAAEAGVSWQKLWGLIDGGVRPSTTQAPRSTGQAAQRPAGPLTERYRPTTLADIVGQQEAVDVLTKFVQAPYSASFVFDGETGTGKTSAALALAQALGCEMSAKEFGGVFTISSGEQSPEAVKETYRMDTVNYCV